MSLTDGAPKDPPALRRQILDAVAARDFPTVLDRLTRAGARFRDDAVVRLAEAEATWDGAGAAAALPHFEAALALDPACRRARARFGLALIEAGRAADGLVELEAVVATLPVGAAIEDAMAPFMMPLAFAPAPADAAFQLGQTMLAVGALDPAIAAFEHAAALDPTSPVARLALGGTLRTRGRDGAAIDALRAAVSLDPDEPISWRALGQTFRQVGQTDEADSCELAALSLERTVPDRELLIGDALVAIGAPDPARVRFERAMAGASWVGPPQPRSDARLRVGVIAAPGRANTPLDFILDRQRLAVGIVLMLDGFAYPYDRIAASYDVLFNAVADPDYGAAATALALGLAERVGLPIANHPRLIAETGRERIAERLSSAAGCVVPATGRYASRSLRDRTVADRALREIGMPLLARPAGSHGGKRLERIDDAATLDAYLAWTTAEEIYLTRYHEFRSPDGRYRKYRFIAVDGALFPYHLAIGEHWLVHYFRTAMTEDDALRAEEADFVAAPFDHVGPDAAAALREVARRITLDFFGIDCAVLPDGRLLLFECNAAMLVRHSDPLALFDYKRAPSEAIRDAVSRMLERRAAASQ